MSLHPITLQTDKTITDFTKDFETVKQSEKGLVLEGTILNADKEPYDLSASGLYLVYCEQKAEGKMIIDKGNGKDPADDAGVMTITDAQNGKFTYKLCQQAYAATGDAWIEIYEGNNFVDSTESFRMVVEPAANIHYENDNYISDMTNILTSLKAEFTRAQSTVDTLTQRLQDQVTNANSSIGKQISDLSSDVKTKTDSIEQEISKYKTEYDGIQSQWDTALKNITDKANTDISAQVTAINTKYTNQLTDLLADLQSDYNAWKASIVKDFNDTVQPIKDSISENDQKLTTVSKQASDTVAEMNSLKQQFDKVDFSKFVTGDTLKNYYTKEETDLRLQQAGKVKSVDNIQPDSNGNINTDHFTKSETTQKLATKLSFVKCDSPQAAYDASKKPADDGSLVIGIYDPDDGPTSAVIGDKTITISSLYESLQNLQTQVSGLSSLQSVVDSKANSADVYLKGDVDKMIANVGKMKTISVNGGAKISPDDSGNANITVDLSSKANQSDLNNTNNRVTAIETGYMKKPTIISKADYDKLATKDPNTLYEITE